VLETVTSCDTAIRSDSAKPPRTTARAIRLLESDENNENSGTARGRVAMSWPVRLVPRSALLEVLIPHLLFVSTSPLTPCHPERSALKKLLLVEMLSSAEW